jgi:hypothetical protein
MGVRLFALLEGDRIRDSSQHSAIPSGTLRPTEKEISVPPTPARRAFDRSLNYLGVVMGATALFISLGGQSLAARAFSSAVKAGSVTSRSIADNTIRGKDVHNGTLQAKDLSRPVRKQLGEADDGSITTEKLAPGAVTGEKLAANSVSASKVTNESLTTADIAGADINGGMASFPAGLVPAGRCETENLTVDGAIAGQAVIVSTQESVPSGMVLYGARVPTDGNVTVDVCNFSGTPSSAVFNLPLRVITFG